MVNLEWIIASAALGAFFGSFAGAQVWRLRARQLSDDKHRGERVNNRELDKLKPLLGKKMADDRSVCLSCKTRLKWYDMIPVVSWLMLRGKCRQCRAPIGYAEISLEVGLAVIFGLSVMFWPYYQMGDWGLVLLALWLISSVVLAILFVYDLKWYLLPSLGTMVYAALGFVYAFIFWAISSFNLEVLISIAMSVFIMSGIYLIIYKLSKGKWIGFGDVKLGLGLGLFLADWRLGFMALFIANLIGCVVVLPLLLIKKMNRRSHVPFGPFLIVGTVLSMLFGEAIVSWYMTFSMSLFL